MKILPVSNNNTNFNGLASKLEKAAEVLSVKTNPNRKSIPIEYHNALVKLTAWRSFALAAALFGFGGYKVSDHLSDNDTDGFINAIQHADIDPEAPVEIKDLTQDGNKELILKKKDGSSLILDFKNKSVLTEASGLKKVK